MISKIKKPVSILLALMMVVSLFTIVPMTVSAAPTESLLITIDSAGHGDNWGDGFVSGSRTFDNIATVSFSDDVYNGDDANGWYYSYEDNKILSVAPAAGYTITKVMFYCKSGSAVDETAPFEANLQYYQMFVNGSSCGQAGVTKIEVYGYATPADPVDYYVVGTMNSWDISEDYKMALNENNTSEYWIQNVPLHSGDEIKVVSSEDGSTVQYWYPDGTDNNLVIGEDGYYNVYVAPAGHNTWHYNCILATKQSDLNYVAQIGDNKYETLEAAFAAAQDGNTITLLADCAGNGIKVTPAGKFATGLTVDFDGHTYTVDGETVGSTGTETNGFQLLKDNKITFKNGTITSTKAKILVQNYSDLTLDGMTLTLDNAGYSGAYTLSNNNGDIVIDGTTINANPAGGFAFDVCRFSSYPSVNVTVKGGSTINGNVEISASKSDAKDGFSLTLESGTMTGDIVLDQTAKNVIAASPEKAVITKEAAFDQAAPADYKWDSTGKLVPCEYVAQVGTAKYETLDAAIAAAQAGDTVKLLADITLPAQSISGESVQYGAYITKSLTIDGDGHTVTSDAPRAFGVKGTQGDIDVTFKNITVTDKQQGAICVCTRGGINSLTLDNATLSTQGATKGYIQPLTIGGSQATKAKVDVINSTIQTGDAAGKHYAIILWNPVDLTIQNSTIKGWACVYQKAFEDASAGVETKVTIDNSTLISKGIKGSSNHFATIFTENAAFTCKITNTTMDITAAADTYQAVAASNGSASGFKVELGEGNNVTLTGDTALIGYNFDDENHEIAVSGGTFNKPVAEYYCADGYIPATFDEETGKYSVKTGAYVAQVNGVKYETLEAAFAAAQDGNTITLLANCAGNGIKVAQGKYSNGLTVDFGGYTYTVDGTTVGSTGTETNGFQLLKDNKITFQNGTITSAKAKILVQNYSNLTLDKMTLTLNNPNYTSAYTLSNNNGNVTIKDTTINANPAGGFAFDVCRYASYPSVKVTVKGDSHINGNVEVFASKSDPKNGFSLTLESGDMSGDIVLDQTAKNVLETAPDKLSVTKAADFNQAAPEGYVWVDTATAGVQTIAKAVAQIGDKKYATLEAAFAAAADGNTITLLADCAGNGIKAPQGKFATGLTVDFDGHTYTVDGTTVGSTGTETQGFQLLKGNKITFENGTITGSSVNTSSLLFLIQNYSDLTLDNMELSLAGKYYNQYTLSNNNGNIVINDSKINAPTYGGVVRHDVNSYAFDVCRFSSYPSVNVTVTGNSTINGDVEVSASNSDAKDGFSLNLNGGTMTGAIVLDDSAKAAMDATPEKASVNKANTFNQDAPEGYQWVASGEGKQTLAKIVDLFTAHSITLDGNIKLNFYINPEYADFENATSAYVKFSWDDEYTAEVDLKNMVPGEDGYRASVELVAAQMANVVHAEVYLNNAKIGEDDYTVREYAEELYNHPEKYDSVKTNELKALAKALLNYGATAQTVFAEDLIDDPEELANATVGYNGYEEVTAEQIGAKIQGTASNMDRVAAQLGGKFYTSSVIYLNKNTLRLYFTPKTYPGSLDYRDQYSGVQSDYYYYVDSQPIPAAELDRQQIFKVGGIEFNYSALDYAKAVIEKNMDTEYQNLAKALFLYNQAAKAYIG